MIRRTYSPYPTPAGPTSRRMGRSPSPRTRLLPARQPCARQLQVLSAACPLRARGPDRSEPWHPL
eukprot:4381975-Prymnesium_polylepis.1